MAGNEGKTRQQEKAICGLLAQPTIREAAAYANISEGTLYRWLRQDPAFRAAYRQASRECVLHATARLQQACGEAVRTLMDIQTNEDAAASARVTAAKAILDLAYRAIEIEDLEARVTLLEQRTQR